MARISWQLFLVGCVFLQTYTQADPLNRIVNGKLAKPKQFPYQVYVGTTDSNLISYMCGGAIISDRLILTAAHCVENIIKAEIYFGAVNIHDKFEVGQQYIQIKPENIRIHEYYTFPFDDIALIKLPNKLIFDEYIQPATLPKPNIDYSNETVLVPGWGNVDKVENGTKPEQLMYFESRILSPEECSNKGFIWQDIWICTMSFESTQCGGDSGGAVVVPNPDGSVTLVGVNSFGQPDSDLNCLPGRPVIATRISTFLEWIKLADSILK